MTKPLCSCDVTTLEHNPQPKSLLYSLLLGVCFLYVCDSFGCASTLHESDGYEGFQVKTIV